MPEALEILNIYPCKLMRVHGFVKQQIFIHYNVSISLNRDRYMFIIIVLIIRLFGVIEVDLENTKTILVTYNRQPGDVNLFLCFVSSI